MKVQVYIDGSEGTTGLRIFDRMREREDIRLLTIDPALRKDTAERARLINASDITFLCLPDAAAREAVSLIENDHVRVIDASTAHRTAPGWAYGFAVRTPPGDCLRGPRGQSRLPCHRFYLDSISAPRVRRAAAGCGSLLLFADRVQRGWQAHDRPI